jgi:hypothetical protein
MHMYIRLAVALGGSLIAMFLLSLAQVDVWDHFYLNLSNFYISLMGIGAMGIIMVLAMWPMYDNKRLNLGILTGLTALLVGAFVMGRTETFVGDEGFLYSMIPHHSRAILVCEEASLRDPEIIDLCDQIIETQREEITQMEQILGRG